MVTPAARDLLALLAHHLALGALEAVEPGLESRDSRGSPSGTGCRGARGTRPRRAPRASSGVQKVTCSEDRPSWRVTATRLSISMARAAPVALGQQPRPRHRRERHRRQQLGVVAAAGAAIALGPAVIEHVLAVGVALDVERRRGDQPPGLLDEQMEGLPAGLLARPSGWPPARRGRRGAGTGCRRGPAGPRPPASTPAMPVTVRAWASRSAAGASAQRSSNMPSTSTAASNGRLGTPTAARACRPGLAQHGDHQVRGTVDHLGVVGEIRRAGDEAAEPQAGGDPIEIAAGGLDLGQDVDRAQPGRGLAVLEADAAAELALVAERCRASIGSWPETIRRLPLRRTGM